MDRTGAAIAALGTVLLAMGPLDGAPLVGSGYDAAMFRSHLGLFYLAYGGVLAAVGSREMPRVVAAGLLSVAFLLLVSVGTGLSAMEPGTTITGVLVSRLLLGVAFLPLVGGLPLGLAYRTHPRGAAQFVLYGLLCWPATLYVLVLFLAPPHVGGPTFPFGFGTVLGASLLLFVGLFRPGPKLGGGPPTA